MTFRTKVVNVRHHPYDFYCGRAGRGEKGTFGNPYTITPSQPRAKCIELYRAHFNFKVKEDPEFVRALDKLVEYKRAHGGALVLGCFCAEGMLALTAMDTPFTCHAQVIAEYIDSREP